MKRKINLLAAVAVVGVLGVAGAAIAAVTFDSETGKGFVGKGDVQLALEWNNKQLQDNVGSVSFSYDGTTTTVDESTWTCTHPTNGNTQERGRTTTTTSSTAGVVSKIARERNQITGFVLDGYSGTPTHGTPVVETDGQQLFSCPSNWTLSDPQTLDPVTTTTGGLYVRSGSGASAPIG